MHTKGAIKGVAMRVFITNGKWKTVTVAANIRNAAAMLGRDTFSLNQPKIAKLRTDQ